MKLLIYAIITPPTEKKLGELIHVIHKNLEAMNTVRPSTAQEGAGEGGKQVRKRNDKGRVLCVFERAKMKNVV